MVTKTVTHAGTVGAKIDYNATANPGDTLVFDGDKFVPSNMGAPSLWYSGITSDQTITDESEVSFDETLFQAGEAIAKPTATTFVLKAGRTYRVQFSTSAWSWSVTTGVYAMIALYDKTASQYVYPHLSGSQRGVLLIRDEADQQSLPQFEWIVKPTVDTEYAIKCETGLEGGKTLKLRSRFTHITVQQIGVSTPSYDNDYLVDYLNCKMDTTKNFVAGKAMGLFTKVSGYGSLNAVTNSDGDGTTFVGLKANRTYVLTGTVVQRTATNTAEVSAAWFDVTSNTRIEGMIADTFSANYGTTQSNQPITSVVYRPAFDTAVELRCVYESAPQATPSNGSGGVTIYEINPVRVVKESTIINNVIQGAGTTINSLDDVTDVHAPAPNTGDVLTWNSTSGSWEASAVPSIPFNSLSDVTITNPQAGEGIIYNGTAWVNNASGAGKSGRGSWTLAPGANTVAFTVDANTSYNMWVRGNIPNGIVAWAATVMVTNTNVPVIGNQYGWYYVAGNQLVLNAIPSQIVGTSGSIITTTPTLVLPTNTFRFTITNNSSSNQQVEWGWVTL